MVKISDYLYLNNEIDHQKIHKQPEIFVSSPNKSNYIIWLQYSLTTLKEFPKKNEIIFFPEV